MRRLDQTLQPLAVGVALARAVRDEESDVRGPARAERAGRYVAVGGSGSGGERVRTEFAVQGLARIQLQVDPS